MKCVNCAKPALWVWTTAYTDDLAYCEDHLPRFLYPTRKAGLLQTTEEYVSLQDKVAKLLESRDPEAVPVPRKRRSPKSSVNIEEEVVEEVVDESLSDAS